MFEAVGWIERIKQPEKAKEPEGRVMTAEVFDTVFG